MFLYFLLFTAFHVVTLKTLTCRLWLKCVHCINSWQWFHFNTADVLFAVTHLQFQVCWWLFYTVQKRMESSEQSRWNASKGPKHNSMICKKDICDVDRLSKKGANRPNYWYGPFNTVCAVEIRARLMLHVWGANSISGFKKISVNQLTFCPFGGWHSFKCPQTNLWLSANSLIFCVR